MTSERDFDRLARAWLESGPDEAPDRVIAVVLQAAQTTPQARRPMGGPLRRSLDMTRLPMAAGIAAVLVAVIGASMLISSGGGPFGAQTPIATPTTSPAAASPAPSDAAVLTLPAALPSSEWLGDHRSILAPGAGAAIRFSGDSVSVTAAGHPSSAVLTSSASPIGDDASRILLETRAGDRACQTGDRGTYSWSVSASGRIMTVDMIGDACAARSAAIGGTWWRMGCKLVDSTCLGDLDPGTYKSQFIAPRLSPGTQVTPDVGGVTYTVPAGWANSADTPTHFHLTPSESFATETQGGPQNGLHEIEVGVAPHANKVTPDCGPSVDETVDGTVDGLLAWIAEQPALTSTKPVAITIDGHPGKWVDIQLAPTWTTTCTSFYGDQPERAFLTYPPGTDNTWTATLAGPERDRLLLLDLGGGQTVAVIIDSYDAGSFDELVSQAMPIVQSFTFQ